MPKIIRVDAVTEGRDGLSGVRLDVELDNMQVVMLSLSSQRENPDFLRLWEEKRLFRPETDGARVFWSGGPSLTLDDIVELVRNCVEKRSGHR